MTSDRRKKTYTAQLDRLPPGTFITVAPDELPYLVLEDTLLPWSPSGYGPPIGHLAGKIVGVLTPRSVVNTLAQGYPAIIHPSAFGNR